MGFLDTIERPWRQPVAYLELAFWLVIFIIVAFAIMDTLRVLATFVKEAT